MQSVDQYQRVEQMMIYSMFPIALSIIGRQCEALNAKACSDLNWFIGGEFNNMDVRFDI